MKRILLGVSLFICLVFVLTAFKEDPAKNELQIDSMIPPFKLTNEQTTLTIGQPSKKFTVITFWSSEDGESRQACNLYDELITSDSTLKEKTTFYGINLDKSDVIFEEILKNDKLEKSTQFHINSDDRIKMAQLYGLDKGYGSVLISPSGKIKAFNPSISDIVSLLD